MTAVEHPLSPSSSEAYYVPPLSPSSPTPSETQDSVKTPDPAAPSLYFKTTFKIIRLTKFFFTYVFRKNFKILNSLQTRVLDFLVSHFPKMGNFQKTVTQFDDPSELEIQLHKKANRHSANFKERLNLLKTLLQIDEKPLQKGKMTQETHLMRYLQIAVMKLAYCLDAAAPIRRIPLPSHYLNSKLPLDHEQNSYRITLLIKHKGLVAYGLEPPENSSAPPLLLIKGTSTTNLSQILADLNDAIGSNIYESNEEALYQWIRQHTKSKVIVAGHSLGGAIAQIIGCKNHALIQAIVTFASPSPGKELVKEFKEIQKKEEKKIKDLKTPQIPEVYHFINDGDLIPYAGGFSCIYGRTFELEVPSTLSIKGRHSHIDHNQITNQTFLDEHKIEKRRFLRVALEIARWTFSFFLTWAIRFLAKKQTRNLTRSVQMKELRAATPRFPLKNRRYSIM